MFEVPIPIFLSLMDQVIGRKNKLKILNSNSIYCSFIMPLPLPLPKEIFVLFTDPPIKYLFHLFYSNFSFAVNSKHTTTKLPVVFQGFLELCIYIIRRFKKLPSAWPNSKISLVILFFFPCDHSFPSVIPNNLDLHAFLQFA